MADTEKAIAALKEARPPASDAVTYLTIIESHLSPDIMPTLNEILQDVNLAQEIGWDLPDKLISIHGSEACLETIARLGNPREVILKVHETLMGVSHEQDDSDEIGQSSSKGKGKERPVTRTQKFITLLGMLAILHKRISTRYPSRFLAQTLQVVLKNYEATQETTAAIINLVHSLASRRRPPLPTRRSSINVANPDLHGDASRNAPDPEADHGEFGAPDGDQVKLMDKMLLTFVLCVLEKYVNKNDMCWAARLVEFFEPEKIVPGKKTMMARFREDQVLLERDAIVGKLVALTRDLGVTTCSKEFMTELCDGCVKNDPLANADATLDPDDIELSTGGCVVLVAYWVFSATIFDADQPQPNMHIFPAHFALLDKFLQDDTEGQIQAVPGTIAAFIALGIWLYFNDFLAADPESPLHNEALGDGATSDYMTYIHILTLNAVYHPDLHVRNATTILAGNVFHADPSDEDRLSILEDMIKNCTFPQLKAQAVAWLRDEIAKANPLKSKDQPSSKSNSIFAKSDCLDRTSIALFPRTVLVQDQSATAILTDFLMPNLPFLLATVNFGIFLWSKQDRFKALQSPSVPLPAAVLDRFAKPLKRALDRIMDAYKKELGISATYAPEAGMPSVPALPPGVEVLIYRLQALMETETLRNVEDAQQRA